MAPGGALRYCAEGSGMQWMCEILDLVPLTCLHRKSLGNEINVWRTGGPFLKMNSSTMESKAACFLSLIDYPGSIEYSRNLALSTIVFMDSGNRVIVTS